MTGPKSTWGLRLGAVLLLVAVHVGIWRPVRSVLVEHVALPVAEAIDTPRSGDIELGLEPRTVTAVTDGVPHRFYAPAALSYLVVAVVLVAVWPHRLYWLWLWGAHVVLGGLAFGAFLLGVGVTAGGFAAATFVQNYLVPAIGLVALVAASLPRAGQER